MFRSLFQFLTEHINEVTCGGLLRDLAQRVHGPDADLNDAIHVIPLVAYHNFHSQVLHEDLYRTQLALVVYRVFLYQ